MKKVFGQWIGGACVADGEGIAHNWQSDTECKAQQRLDAKSTGSLWNIANLTQAGTVVVACLYGGLLTYDLLG